MLVGNNPTRFGQFWKLQAFESTLACMWLWDHGPPDMNLQVQIPKSPKKILFQGQSLKIQD